MDKKGVETATSGYIGGEPETATYEQVITGETSHRESVQIQFYPSIVSYEEVLETYWRTIDPLDSGGQFADRGQQYTTAIYTHNPEQNRIAQESKANLTNQLGQEVVTEIHSKDNNTFYRAEDRHQNYSRKNSMRYEAYKRGSGRTIVLDRYWENHPFK